MRLCRGFATAAWLGTVGLAAPARAQHVEGRATATLTGGYSQTLSDSPTLTGAGPLLALSPALTALVDSPRTTNTFTYTFSLSVPFTRTTAGQPLGVQSVSYANRLSYTGHYEVSEVTSATLGAGFAQAPLNSVDLSQNPASASVQSIPTGAAILITVNANEGLSRQLSNTLSGSQAFAFAFGDPIDLTPTTRAVLARTFSITNSLSLSRAFERGNFVFSLANQTNAFTASQAPDVATSAGPMPGVFAPASEAFVNTASVGYSYPFTESLTGSATVGVSQVLSPNTSGYQQIEPTGTLGLNYAYRLATAALTLSHTAMPNLATATLAFTDMANLRVSIPIGTTGLTTLGTVGFTHTTPVGTVPAGGQAGPTNVFLTDADVKYTPPKVQTLSVGVRGIITRQWIPDALPGSGATFTRYTLTLNLTYSYPNVRAAQIPPSFNPGQAPTPTDIVSTDRFFSEPPAEEPPPSQ